MEKAILTVTLNPAVDKTYTAQTVMIGQVNRMLTMKKLAGGKGVNVTKILRQYGFPVNATGFLGGSNGKFIEEELIRRGAKCSFVEATGETRSNMNIAAEDGFVTELLEPGPEIGDTEQELFLRSYAELIKNSCLVILSGSVPDGIRKDIYGELIQRAKTEGVPVYLDSSGESLRQGIVAAPDLVKPNWKELEFLMGHRIADSREVVEAAQYLQEMGIRKVIVSMGSKGLISVSKEGVYRAVSEKIRAVNTVACGDSVVASYAMSACLGETEEEAIRRACAVAAANATTLESADIPVQTAEKLLPGIYVEQLRGVRPN